MRIFVSDGCFDFEGVVDDDADLDGSFLITEDDGQVYRISGWQACDLEVLEG